MERNFVQDTSDVFQLSGSHLEKSPIHFDNKLVGNQNPVYSKSDTSFCEITLGSVKGVLTSLDIKLHRNVELYNELNGIVELVGCYVHPMPVFAVLLSAKENEIYVVFYVAF